MSSGFKPCRACGEPVFVGAKRCPNCRAVTSWRGRLPSISFPLLILALVALIIVGVTLYGRPDQTGAEATTGQGESDRPQASSLPPPASAGNLSRPPLSDLPRTSPGAASTGAAQTVAALAQRDTERADAITVRGKRIEPGMSADRLFELVSQRDLLGQTMEPDPFNPPNLQFVKYYRIDNQEFAVELRKANRDAPYRVTSIRVEHSGERASTNR